EDQPAKPKAPPPAKEPRGSRPSGSEPEDVELPPAPDINVVKKSKRKEPADEFAVLPVAKPTELQQRLSALEKHFLELEGPLYAPERQALWPDLAALNSALNHATDAAVSWINALWETDAAPAEWLGTWAKSEARLPGREVTGADFDRLLAITAPSQ